MKLMVCANGGRVGEAMGMRCGRVGGAMGVKCGRVGGAMGVVG